MRSVVLAAIGGSLITIAIVILLATLFPCDCLF
jgi:hypothetical protein